jgi:hypothetical protein
MIDSIGIRFLSQTVGLILLRTRQPDLPRPGWMWFHPSPASLAIFGFLYVLVMRHNFHKELSYATELSQWV